MELVVPVPFPAALVLPCAGYAHRGTGCKLARGSTSSSTDVDAPAAQAHVERQIEWARGALGKLGERPVTVSMTAAQAVARATAVFKLKQSLADDAIDVGLVIALVMRY